VTGLRRRLFVYLAAAAALSVALTVAVLVVLGTSTAGRDVRAALGRQADAVATALNAAGGGAHRQARVFVVRAGRVMGPLGGPRGRQLRQAATDAPSGTLGSGGRELLYVSRQTRSGPIVVARPRGAQPGDERSPLPIALIAGAGGLALAFALATLLARRLVRPLHALIAATARVGRGEPPAPVPVHGDDELADLAAAFNAMARDLAHARDAERRFLAAVSHDLRTPLTSVRGYAEALEDGTLPARESGAAIVAEAERLERLVADLLALASAGRADFAVATTPVDLAAIAAAAAERHGAAAERGGVRLVVDAPQPAGALGDRERILQALSNLVDNAVRLTPPEGTVRIAAAAGRLAVLDDGPGLDDADVEEAFVPFALHRRHGTARAGTTGLGLAVVGELAGAMGGRATARRRPEGGAEFAIDLPRAAPPAAAPSPPAALWTRTSGR
jgi:two-component system, OmpR family, sensor kinase